MNYARSIIYVDPKDHKELRKRLKKEGKSLSRFFREKAKEYLKQK